MAPRPKRRRESTCAAAPEAPVAWTLPADLMLEIILRSNPRVLFRFAAACKLLRRDILGPSFIRRASHQAAPCILAHLCTYRDDKPLTLLHPSTTVVAASFCQDHLQRSMSRKVVSLLGRYRLIASRRGLLLLCRNIRNRPKSDRCSDMCVYDSMSGARTFLSRPPDIKTTNNSYHKYVLLTAADGIGSSFLLLVADLYGRSIKVQTASPCGSWGPVTRVSDDKHWWCFVKLFCDPAVLRGGVIHWLHPHSQILSYDLGTGKTGSLNLPSTTSDVYQLHLATSSDGELLKLVSIEGFMISVWLQLPVSATGGGWALMTVIDVEEKLRLMYPEFPPHKPDVPIEFEGSGTRNGDVVLLRVDRPRTSDVVVLDLETMDMHRQEWGCYLLVEIDLPSRLRNMKIFS